MVDAWANLNQAASARRHGDTQRAVDLENAAQALQARVGAREPINPETDTTSARQLSPAQHAIVGGMNSKYGGRRSGHFAAQSEFYVNRRGESCVFRVSLTTQNQ